MPESSETLAHYRLEKRLGAGGMGEVFLARDTKLGRAVAIKILLGAEAGDPEARRRLVKEAQAAAALDHPNICAVYEVGADALGRDFIVMQYVEGETLAARLARGRLDVRTSLELAAGVAEALEVAHARGVVHRDLKPQNIMVTPSGRPMLLDFGIARRQRPLDGLEARHTTTHMESGGLAGTPAYMAPERLQGERADARSDLFSLGVVLFECLTGRQPFQGGTPVEVSGRVLHVDPGPPSRTNREVAPYIDQLCAQLLSKRPADRFQTAGEVRGAIGTALGTATSDGRRRWPVAVAVTLAAVMAAAAAALKIGVVTGGSALPQPPAQAIMWNDRGVDALRQGNFTTARRALDEAIRLFPDYALAYSRLAEALAEVDDERGAQAALLRVMAIVPDQSRLDEADRVRLNAIRASVLRDVTQSVHAYSRLTELLPRDAGAVVDLGRAQESAGRLTDARDSYRRATEIDGQSAAAFLRLGSVEGSIGVLEVALQAYNEAARLYTLSSSVEGQVETMLRQGRTLDASGRAHDATVVSGRARELARQAGLLAQEVRATFLLGNAMVGAGRLDDVESLMRTALDTAIANGLQGIAADGLIDLAGAYFVTGRYADADAALLRARAIADERSLTRTSMRAATQRAALKQQQRQPREALALLEAPLKYFAKSHHRRLAAVGESIAARAYLDVGDFDSARRLADGVLTFAGDTSNRDLQVQARTALAGIASAAGDLPGALAHRLESDRILRASGDTEVLPYELTSRAEYLIRMGRQTEAGGLLEELDAAIVGKVGAYPTRMRRVSVLRALQATIEDRNTDATKFAAAALSGRGPADDTGRFAGMLTAVATARAGKAVPIPMVTGDRTLLPVRELVYWRAYALQASGQHRAAARELTVMLSAASTAGGVELEWRSAALSAAAWQASGARNEARVDAERASLALATLRQTWAADATAYERRPDHARLIALLASVNDTDRPSPGESR